MFGLGFWYPLIDAVVNALAKCWRSPRLPDEPMLGDRVIVSSGFDYVHVPEEGILEEIKFINGKPFYRVDNGEQQERWFPHCFKIN